MIPLDPQPLGVGGNSGSLPFKQLLRLYELDQIDQAVADAQSGPLINPPFPSGCRKQNCSSEVPSGGTAMHWIGGQ